MILIAIFAPFLATVDPTAISPVKRLREPSAQYWFGTDMLGRDVYSRVIYGSRVSLLVGFSVAALASVVGYVHRPGFRLHPPDRCGADAGDGRVHVDPVDPAGDRADGAVGRLGGERDRRHQHRRVPPRLAG